VDDRFRQPLETIGQSLGRLIYTLDALADRSRDARTHQFNPFLVSPSLLTHAPDVIRDDVQIIQSTFAGLPLNRHQSTLSLIVGKNLHNTCTAMLEATPPPNRSAHRKRRKDNSTSFWESCCDGCSWFDAFYCCDCDASCCADDLCCDCDVCCCDCS
jgi:hypothetical protein